jgi:hypothetical protein
MTSKSSLNLKLHLTISCKWALIFNINTRSVTHTQLYILKDLSHTYPHRNILQVSIPIFLNPTIPYISQIALSKHDNNKRLNVLTACIPKYHHHHHQPINVHTAGTQAFLMDYT